MPPEILATYVSLSEYYVLIQPFSSSIAIPPINRVTKSWDQYLYWCSGRRGAFYILNVEKITDINNQQQLRENILQRYDINLQDMINLNWEISYPPTEAMKDITMYPPYEEVMQND
ncbi:hypothetical protein AGMMS50233_07830 [Endomicrobiia bacterium]|nr:hypothetical protein AGMMS50233_07830 [Endomicrobiia bacterium]